MTQYTSISFLMMLLLLTLSLSGCLSGPDKQAGYFNVSVSEARSMVDTGRYFILDVRTLEEYDAGHIVGSVLIPYDQLPGRLDEVPENMPVLVYCRTSRRSAIASETLLKNGYREVYNMAGGIIEWERAGYPVEKSY